MRVTTVTQLVPDLDVVLVDASGVLYRDDGPVKGAQMAVQASQFEHRQLFVTTNNTTASPADIAKRFQDHGFSIEAYQILSSGLCLKEDAATQKMIDGKNQKIFNL